MNSMSVFKKMTLATLMGMATFAFLHGATIDQKSVKVEFIGYKTPDMVGTEGSFKNIQYTFGKDTKSLKGTLKGAYAVIIPTSSDIANIEEATNNMNKVFFPILTGKSNIQVVFQDVVEGEKKGLISARITINKQSCVVPMTYEIQNNKLIAKGQLDLNNFSNATKALQALSEAAPGHAGTSWAIVDISFSADVTQ